MNITSQNYESWFLDYYERNLTAQQEKELFLFLDKNPTLKEEFDAFENFSLEIEEVTLNPNIKANLKKETSITEHNINDWLIAELEGDLSLQELALLTTFLSTNPVFLKDRELFRKTRLIKTQEKFDNKKSLYRGKVISINSPLQKFLYVAAACFALLIGSYFIYNQFLKEQTETAEIEKPIEKPFNDEKSSIIPPNQSQKDLSIIDSSSNLENKIEQEVSISDQKIATIEKSIIKSSRNKSNSKPKLDNSIYLANNIASIDTNKNKRTIENLELLSPIALTKVEEDRIYISVQRRRVTTNDDPIYKNATKDFITNLKDETVARIDNTIDASLESSDKSKVKLPLKSKLIQLFANGVTRVSGEKIKLKTTYNPLNGTLAAYELEVGKKVIQKQF
jgi:hypothetical protein